MPRFVCPQCRATVTLAQGEPSQCPRCGFRAANPGASAGYRAAVPAGGGGGYPSPFGGGGFSPPVPQPPGASRQWGTNGMAISSLVLGLVGLFTFWLVVPPLLAIIFGIVGLVQTRKRGQPGKGMAIAGLVLGSLVAVIFAVIFTLILIEEVF